MTSKPVIAVGHSALDYVYRVAELPRGATKLRANEHIASGGGMAANAAAAIGRLGGTVALWSRIGEDAAGAIVRDELRWANVDQTHVRAFPGLPTPTAAVIVDHRGERQIVSEDDHQLPLDAGWLPLGDVASAGAVLSDLTWLEGTLALFRAARDNGVPTVLDIDLGSGQLLQKVIGLTDYAIFSAPAFAHFIEGTDHHARLRHLIGLGASHAGVTLGAHGYHWINRDGTHGTEPALPVDAIDTTGAGDAFHGAFAFSLASGFDEKGCARLAAAVAALSCRRLGARAGLPTWGEVEGLLEVRAVD